MTTLLSKKYRLENGNIYWHKLYFDIVPAWMTKYGPPFGDYNYAAYLYRPHKYIVALWDHARWFVQRGVRGYSDADVWNWYLYMAMLNSAALRRLAEKKLGHPFGMTMKGWRTRLMTMAEGFQAVVDKENDTTSYKKLSHKAYMKLIRERHRKLCIALRCFQKYYYHLWD